jgi:hypothetical protein
VDDLVGNEEKVILNNSMQGRFPHPLWEAESGIQKIPFATCHLSPCPFLVAGVRNNSQLTDVHEVVPAAPSLRSAGKASS